MAHAVVVDQRGHLPARALLVGVVDGDRVSSEILHQPHAGDVGGSVADVDHVFERHGALVLGNVAVDHLRVEDRFHALVDLEHELRLVGVVDRHGGPVGDAVHVVEERAGVDLAELVGDLRSLDDLLETRRVDVVEDADAPLFAVAVDSGKPLPDAVEERHAAARLLERLAFERESLRLGLLDHPRHVRKDHVGVLLLGERVGLGPELLVALADGRNEVVFLHVARSERSVEVVDQCYGKSEFHRFQSFDFKAAKNQMAAKPYGMRFGKTFRQMKGPQRPRHQR